MNFGMENKGRPYDLLWCEVHYRGLHARVGEYTDQLRADGLRPLDLAKVDRPLVLHTSDSTPVLRQDKAGLWHSVYRWAGGVSRESLPEEVDGIARLATGPGDKPFLVDVELAKGPRDCGAAVQLVSLWVEGPDAIDLAGGAVTWLPYSLSSDPNQMFVGLFAGQEDEYARFQGADRAPAMVDAAGSTAVLAELSEATLISLLRHEHPGAWMRASPTKKRKLVRELREQLLKERAKYWN